MSHSIVGTQCKYIVQSLESGVQSPESRVPPEWVPTFESVALLSIDMDDVVIGTLNMFTGQRSCSMVVGYNTYGVDFSDISVGETGFVPFWFISSSKD